MCDRGIARKVSTQVERCSRLRGDGQLADADDLVGRDSLLAHDDAGARSRVLGNDLDRRGRVDPFRAE
jgi:hypothetical protein